MILLLITKLSTPSQAADLSDAEDCYRIINTAETAIKSEKAQIAAQQSALAQCQSQTALLTKTNADLKSASQSVVHNGFVMGALGALAGAVAIGFVLRK